MKYRRDNPIPTGTVEYLGQTITHRQREVMRIIEEYYRKHMIPPAYRDIIAELGVSSTNSVSWHLGALRRKGLIDWEPKQTRGIRLTKYHLVLIHENHIDDVREFVGTLVHGVMIERAEKPKGVAS